MSEEDEENNESSREQDDGEEEEESHKIKRHKKIDETKSNNSIKKSRTYYLSIINKLKNELESEKKINNVNNEKKSLLKEEYEKLQDELSQKNKLLEKLKSTSKKQKNAIIALSKKIEQETSKINKIGKDINDIEQEKSNIKNKEILEEDKKLDKATKTMRNLSSENIALIQILNGNKDYNSNVILENLNKEIKEKLEQKTDEQNSLTKLLKIHLDCKEEQKLLNKDINKLTDELKKLKITVQKIKDKTEELILQNYFDQKNIPNKKKIINQTIETNNFLYLNKIKHLNNSTPNIHSNKNLKNNLKNINLPLIISKKSIQEKSIFNDNFFKKIKNAFKENENEYITLTQKIKLVETKRKQIENKNKNEIDEKNLKLNTLDERFKKMKNDERHSDLNCHILKNKFNIISLHNKQKAKQLKELQNKLQNENNIMKTKNDEISKLTKTIKSIRELISLCLMNVEEIDIKNIFKQIDKEKKLDLLINDYKEETKNDNTITTKKNTCEESIQTDSINNKTNKKKKIKKDKIK